MRTPPFKKLQTEWPRVPRLCSGGTVAIFAGGPSLTPEDVDYCRDKVDASIAVNNSYKLAPWATALYAADGRWYKWHQGVPSFKGLKYTLSQSAGKWPDVQVLKNAGSSGLELEPFGLRNGRNGGYQAINLAVHFGAKRIILLGFDMQRGPKGQEHWHGDHPNRSRSPYTLFLKYFQFLVNPLNDLGVEVINCSPVSALEVFPKAALRVALPAREAAVA
jgi:hypothetical protein